MALVEPTRDMRGVVAEVMVAGEITIVRALADRGYEVIELSNGEMRCRSQLIQDIGKRNDGFIIVDSLDQVFVQDIC